jgi:hypothetical protein
MSGRASAESRLTKGSGERGAVGVLFVDPALPQYTLNDPGYTVVLGDGLLAGVDPYLRTQRNLPPTATGGVPVLILETGAAAALLDPLGLDIHPFAKYAPYAGDHTRPAGRDLGLSARIEVPLQDRVETSTSYIGEVPGFPPEMPHVLVWAPRQRIATPPAADVLSASARIASARHQPFIFVDFDPGSDESANRARIVELVKTRHISLVVVVGRLDGTALKVTTPHGDLIPAFDRYAEAAGIRHQLTRTTPPITVLSGIAPLVGTKTVLLAGGSGDGDLRPDAAALLGYLAGRYALGAEELPR